MKFKTIQVQNIINDLPRTQLRVGLRDIKNIKMIVVHHDAQVVVHGYDPINRYKEQAQYHINKDWNSNPNYTVRGDGIMYTFKIDAYGNIYQVRPLEHKTWHASNANSFSLSICLDGNFTKHKPTNEQLKSLEALLNELCTQHPEFPASKKDVYGHGELTKYRCFTQCPGELIEVIQEYRENGTISSDMIYKDVPNSHLAAKEIQFCLDNEILMGDNWTNIPDSKNRTFRPDSNVTRWEMAIISERIIKFLEKKYGGNS
jgi:hypothetical protein